MLSIEFNFKSQSTCFYYKFPEHNTLSYITMAYFICYHSSPYKLPKLYKVEYVEIFPKIELPYLFSIHLNLSRKENRIWDNGNDVQTQKST